MLIGSVQKTLFKREKQKGRRGEHFEGFRDFWPQLLCQRGGWRCNFEGERPGQSPGKRGIDEKEGKRGRRNKKKIKINYNLRNEKLDCFLVNFRQHRFRVFILFPQAMLKNLSRNACIAAKEYSYSLSTAL